MRRWLVPLILGLLLMLGGLSGCTGSGSARQESWPGMIVADETLYAANWDRVEAFNAESGKFLWSFPDETQKGDFGPFYSTPFLDESFGEHGLLLVAGFKDQLVYALELGESRAERPDLLWTFAGAAGQYVGSGVVADDLFIIGNGDGKVYAINLEDGLLAWSFAAKDRVWATPVEHDGVVYIASLDRYLYAVDLKSGTELWSYETSGAISATPVLVGDDLCVGNFNKELFLLDLETQEIIWEKDMQGWVWATPLLDESTLYVADVSGNIYALDAETGTMLWDEPTKVDDSLRGRPALNIEGDMLFVPGFESGSMYAMEAKDGSLRVEWGVVLSNPGRLPGDLVTDGQHVYAMPILIKERIYAYDVENGAVRWTSPPSDSN